LSGHKPLIFIGFGTKHNFNNFNCSAFAATIAKMLNLRTFLETADTELPFLGLRAERGVVVSDSTPPLLYFAHARSAGKLLQ
jgi:hypothetical protein